MESLYTLQPAVLLGAVAVLGLMVGSFLNVVILRYPRRLMHQWKDQCRQLLELEPCDAPTPPGIVSGRSRCPSCGHSIRAFDNIPLLSWLMLRGRCRHCQAPISWRYPLVEALTAVLSVIVVWQLGPGAQGLAALLLTWALIAAAGIDFDYQLLPDQITIPLLWIGLLLNIQGLFVELPSAVIGAVAGYLVLWAVFHLFRLLTGKEGMGYGDFKLLAAIGAWFGWQVLPSVILLASLVGAVTGIVLIVVRRGSRNVPIAFGPYLAAAGWLMLFFRDPAAAFWMLS
ncbi:MAG: A24 family peptidase [Wenzhouxiangellaceae bacterium]